MNRDPQSVGERIRRTTEIDPVSNQLIYRWHQPFAIARHDGVDIEIGAETTAVHRIDPEQPLSACSRFEHELTAIHGQHRFVTKGIADVSADADHYHVQGSLRVEEDGDEVFRRNWSRSIPRKHA